VNDKFLIDLKIKGTLLDLIAEVLVLVPAEAMIVKLVERINDCRDRHGHSYYEIVHRGNASGTKRWSGKSGIILVSTPDKSPGRIHHKKCAATLAACLFMARGKRAFPVLYSQQDSLS
jgi:hypothetical protein